MQRHFEFGHTLSKNLQHRRTANIADPCTLPYKVELLYGFSYTNLHRQIRDIDEFAARQSLLQFCAALHGKVIKLDSKAGAITNQLRHRNVEIVFVPIGVYEVVVPKRLSPRLASIDIGAYGG